MKMLETARKTIQKVAAAVVKAAAPEPGRPRDPWYFDDERKAEVRARASGRWLSLRRGGWLR